MQTGFKIDLYIFIYAYIKKEWAGAEIGNGQVQRRTDAKWFIGWI